MCPDLYSVTGNKSTNSSSGAVSSGGKCQVDETFDLRKSASYHLSFELSPRTISFCVLDTLSNKYIALYQEEIANEGLDKAGTQLLTLLQTQELLSAKYKSSSIIMVSEQFTTVPEAIFNPAKARTFLDFNIEGTERGIKGIEVLSDKMKSIDAHSVYALSGTMLTNLRSALVGVSILHHTTSLLDTLLRLYKNQNQEICFLHVQKGIFSIVVIKGNDLKLCNNFLYNSKEDLVYYTLFVFEQLKLNPESVDTVLLGEIDKSTEEYAIIYTYIRNLRFIDRNQGFNYSYVLDSLPPQYHFNLFSQYHCVS
ncbi:MAG TPA: DUF3822 family protein [Flavobacteriales bacterium]|nr:DUF3822 family protein [Flavobacteriales bacterium]